MRARGRQYDDLIRRGRKEDVPLPNSILWVVIVTCTLPHSDKPAPGTRAAKTRDEKGGFFCRQEAPCSMAHVMNAEATLDQPVPVREVEEDKFRSG
jgi:hypothetical protein